jgi:hypothetical protein
MWVLFHVPSPTPDGQSARDLYDKRVAWITDAMRASAREHGCTFHRCWHAVDGSAFYALAHWRTREGARAFFDEWRIDDEPGEVAILLEGDLGLVALGGDATTSG